MLQTGIRVGELCALRWNDFDWSFTCIRIDESLTDARFENSTKTENSERTIPLTSFLQQEYRELYEFKQPAPDDYVFINRVGRPYKSYNIDQKFRYIRKCVMELYPTDNISDVTPHYLRHTFTTSGILAGVSLKNMQMLLGHASTRTLMETYLHVNYEDKIESIKLIEKNSNIIIGNSNCFDSDNELKNKWSSTKRYTSIKS